jgi:dihydrolipoamide dehydrogenase
VRVGGPRTTIPSMAVGSSNDFDLVVLGAGTGGYSAAFRAAQLGLKVALVDESKIGGTCLHIGCIPTKALLESAAFTEKVRHAKDYGVGVGDPVIDYAQMTARRDQIVKRLWTGLKSLVDKNKVTWVQGRGRLDGPRNVRVQMAQDGDNPGGERVLQGNDVILATGSRVKSLRGLEPDGKRIITSDDILTTIDRLPKDIIVVGAGAVGVEFASMYHDLGVKVTLLEYLPTLVPLEDREVSQALERSFTRRGMTVMTNARFDPKAVKVTKTGVSLSVGPEGKDASEIGAEQLLVATGRAPNIEDVGLETTKAEIERGFVKVDLRTMRTREPHLYAIGDVVGGLMLAHTAGHEGLLAAHTIAGDKDTHPMDYVEQPRATYCRPEIASVGLTEQQCQEQGLPYKVGKVPFQAVAKALIGGEYEGFAKIIGNTETGDTLGVHVIGPHATDLISEATLAFTLDATPWEIGATTHAHPTLAEIVGEAAMAVDGKSINF